MSRVNITIDKGSRVFILEDEEERLKWFYRALDGCSITDARSYHSAVYALTQTEPFDVMFLDHDLGEPEAKGTGEDVVRHLAAKEGLAPFVVVHSWNPVGAQNMRNRIDHAIKAVVCPFGAFDINVR